MPPMEREKHEALLNELLSLDLAIDRKTEILQQLRVDYGTVHTEFAETTEKITKLSEDNTALVVSNSKLFRQLGTQDDPSLRKKEESKTFSETVTLESLEKQQVQ